ncbi:MAG: fumarylacetoacetate hydrolase family protein [Selenomonadaceae bacterium]|nr:fumarylacetoacetate hydrolase family protein [Selenomonadaceae bacterium]
MKLFQYHGMSNDIRVGAVTENGHVALPSTVKMEDLLGLDDAALKDLLAKEVTVPLKQENIKFAPVVTHPEKILCIGLNYDEHINETKLETRPGFPPVFCKFANGLVGHGGTVHIPEKAKQVDYEAELVIVIGKECKNVNKENALDYAAGYTAGNDVSARDMQFASTQWTMGKACDDFAPVGPYIVTADCLNPGNLAISSRVNGELAQNSNTCKMIYSCAEIISYLSALITLKKGDLIFTGTPSGVILGKEESARVWLKAGDAVTVEIEGIGVLESRFA